MRVYGSKSLLYGFEQVNDDKTDYPNVKLGDIEVEGFKERNQIVLHFKDLVVSGEYSFTNDFLNHFFQMGSFSKFCFKHGYTDLILDCLRDLKEKRKEERGQYRLILKDDNYYIIGLTSTTYNNYDNHIAIYLALLSLHSYAKREGVYFKVVRAYLTD
ncbi:hypothetical protein AB1K84_23585 [Mesobacillus foraminis]|uniref:hypothetical protein n=1 Tax=Mesobacillus foraminis TaxID=279826 RepID=UPI0039A06C1E